MRNGLVSRRKTPPESSIRNMEPGSTGAFTPGLYKLRDLGAGRDQDTTTTTPLRPLPSPRYDLPRDWRTA
jgi:hypothetical protein